MKSPHRFLLTILIAGILSNASRSDAQHRLIRGSDAPGALAQKRLLAEPELAGFSQPIHVVVPGDGEVAFAEGAGYALAEVGESLVGLQIGPIYRLKIETVLREIPHLVYPSIEMLDRLYPPEGLQLQHPVEVVITQDDVENASRGGMVTKVVYLEDPDTALPYSQRKNEQFAVEVGNGQDPYKVADRLGRPMAIVRIGTRQPVLHDHTDGFHFSFPPVQRFAPPVAAGLSSATTGTIRTVSNQEVRLGDCPSCQSTTGCLCDAGAPCIPCQQPYICDVAEIAKLPKSRRDEYVCDGSDRNLKVIARPDWKIDGLDIEDTIAHFDTLDGQIRVAPSNRVCIYSPRFGAVTRVLNANNTTLTQQLNVVKDETALAAARKMDMSSTTLQNVQLQSNKAMARVNAFKSRTGGVEAESTMILKGASRAFKPYENLQTIRFGKYSSEESARLSLGLQSARAWEGDLSAQIAIDNDQPVIVHDAYHLQELVSIESKTSADLRLFKLASKISAKPGDTVEFTIRFDNIGRQPIRNVTVVDNLSPRLEYVDGTSECSVEASFKSQNNAAGSLTLKWEIDQTLPVGEGGLIRFQCRVR